ncbi:hypothetical protein FHL15_001125 [Xylaria flabelliformis]|uniref:Uncharacterized protein n=1 Tax=Xylaria flabelliformis TaxID=2512241 RepID=A0A553ICI9_9PEZI|nr:hypothetical protein FHL15_001125 [Xylaria flabelliformis]
MSMDRAIQGWVDEIAREIAWEKLNLNERQQATHTTTSASEVSQETRGSKAPSPIMNRDDLFFVNIKYLDLRNNPSKMTDLIEALWLNQTGPDTIPYIIREQVEAAIVYLLKDNFFTTEYHLPKKEALFELAQFQIILWHAAECKAESCAKID